MSVWLLVLAGGSGTRFWPRSRSRRPKQLLTMVGEESLLSTTLRRFSSWIPQERSLIVTTEDLRQPIAEAVQNDFPKVQQLCEPAARNTAPCLVMAMEWIRAKDQDACVVVVPADHWITESQEYLRTMQLAVETAQKKEVLVTIGIHTSRPETGYGYIRSGEQLADEVFQVDRFVEKPSKEVAETMVQSPEYFWNAGMFVWRSAVFFQEMEKCTPELIRCFSPYRQALAAGQEGSNELQELYPQSLATSIDYALLEKSKSVVMVSGVSFHWNDLGSFVSLEEIYPEAEGGVARAKQVFAMDSMANIIDCPEKTVALLGVTDMILVDTGDVLLLASKERAQEVKQIVERLKKEGRRELL